MTEVSQTRLVQTVEGAYLAYRVIEGGELDLVFTMNGGFAIDLIWDDPAVRAFMARLTSFSRVTTFDPRGFGSSGRIDPERVPALQTWTDDIGTVMDAAGVDQAALMSWGESTLAAMMFAATYPRRVRSLVLVNGYARYLRSDDCPWGMPAESMPAYADTIKRLWGTGQITAFTAPCLTESDEGRRRWERAERLSATPDVAVVPQAFMTSDVTDVLASIQAPTLIISRRGDPHVRHMHSRYLADRITTAKHLDLEGDDHVVFSGDTAEILDEIQEFLTGVRPVPLLDRVLATVLFTDIVDSTKTATRLGDRRWRQVLDQYDDLVQRQLERFRGRHIKATGDGTLATFDGPARAVECARAIVESVKGLGVEIRAGVHTGEIELRGDDVAGVAIHVASRVSGLATASQILVSRTVPDLVAGSGIQFDDRGEHELKGVPGTWRLFAVKETVR